MTLQEIGAFFVCNFAPFLALSRFEDVLATFQEARASLGEILSSCEFIDQVQLAIFSRAAVNLDCAR